MRTHHVITAMAFLLIAAQPACSASSEGGGDGDTDGDADGDTDTDTDTDSDTDSDTDGDTDGDTDTESETESETVEEGSLQTGESCSESIECAGDAECVSGEYTSAYCAPMCAGNEDCQDEATGQCGQCLDAGEFMFCMYYCQIGGTIAGCEFTAVCPGDMECDGAVCR